MVDVTADLDRVRVRLDGRLVADHARVWARRTTVTDPAHVADRGGPARAGPTATRGRRPLRTIWCGIWPTTTARSGSIDGGEVA